MCAEKSHKNLKIFSLNYVVKTIIKEEEMTKLLTPSHIDELETRTKNLFQTLNGVFENIGTQLMRDSVHHDCK